MMKGAKDIRGRGYCFWNTMSGGKANGGDGETEEGGSAERIRE